MLKTMSRTRHRWTLLLICGVALLAWAIPMPLAAQGTGVVQGTVTRADDGKPIRGVVVNVRGTRISASTGRNGQYRLARVPAGDHVLVFRWLGFNPSEVAVAVAAGGTRTEDVALTAAPIQLSEVIVEGASRAPERIVAAPAAISVVDIARVRDLSVTGQAPRVLATVVGADVVQSGVNDYNVNSRGFNSSLTRRMLVLQDGRDLAVAFLGSQEWNALTTPLEDIARIEMVRGPGSALYGANAYSGVISLTTPSPREMVGTKLSLGGGELSTFRADLRHAGVSRDGRFGYKINLGYNQSDTWTTARTALDGSDAAAEYGEATDDLFTTGVASCSGITNCLPIEARPLFGQTADANGVVSGDPDPVRNTYGSARLDYYLDDGSIATAEGGAALVENGTIITGIGRVQIDKALRPWARVGVAADRFNVMAWWAGRNARDPQTSLPSGIDIEDKSDIFHGEAQYNRPFMVGGRPARVVIGGSARNYRVDTKETLIPLANDDRSDWYYSAFGQLEFEIVPQLRFVGAARYDKGDLFDAQFSPKGALVFSPNDRHSFRFTVNKAFQTPNQLEYFLRVDAAAPTASPATLEQSVEGYYATLTDPTQVGPALAGLMATLNLPADLPWNFDALTRIRARGNDSLKVEKVTGWEVGYKGAVSDNAYVTLDLYYNRLTNFVSDLLPGVNPQYPTYDLDSETDVLGQLATIDATLAAVGLPPEHPLRAPIPLLMGGYNALVAATDPALTTVNGTREIVVSYTNAGKVQEYGVEVGLNVAVTPEVTLEGNYTLFEFDVDESSVVRGDQLQPNTPKHKVNLAASYTGTQGFDFSVSAKFVDSYDWAAGAFNGLIPASQTLDISAGYQISPFARIHAVATNLLDQQRYHIYGGSVIGRRVLGGMTVTF